MLFVYNPINEKLFFLCALCVLSEAGGEKFKNILTKEDTESTEVERIKT